MTNYFVILAGRNRRQLSVKEQKLANLAQAAILSFFTMVIILAVLFVLYIIKSALGIDIFKDYSFGVWSWFKSLFT